jgi:ribose transport system ATP-binding protein
VSKTLLRMENISKTFPGVRALEGVSIDLAEGSVLGLLGENGAGKSTLMNVLGGIYQPDDGRIFIGGEEVRINSVETAQRLGIAFIHQELALVPYLSAAENIFLGREHKNRLGMVSKSLMYEAAKQYLRVVGLDIEPDTKVSRLSTGQQQMVEIAKAFSLNAKIVVMDEPTSSLSEKEVEVLFKTVRELQRRNIGIIYISHKMSEIFELTDRVIVMRDGCFVGDRITASTEPDELIHMMVGRELSNYYTRTYNTPGDIALEVKDITSARFTEGCSFTLRKGEVLGFYGLIGAGRSELMELILGFDRRSGGDILVFGKRIAKLTPRSAYKIGLALVPENRKTQGLILGNSVAFNASLAVIGDFIRNLRVDRKREREIVDRGIKSMDIKTPSSQQKVVNLSGGNQQKVVLAKWLATKPRILILDEPTKGIDVGAKAEVYKIINDLAASGLAVIMVSSELNEILNICDRVAVMWDNKISAIMDRSEFSQDKILKHALGGNK